MKLTIIGSWSAYPKVNEASSGYLLEHNGFHLLIDCGSGVLSKMQRYIEPAKLDACIISHYHTDHIADIGVLQHALLVNYYLTGQKETKPLPIYGHELDQEAFSKLTYKHITTGIRYDPNQPLSVGPFTITFIQTKHPVPCFAMRIETAGKAIVYTADSAYQSAFVNFSKNADLLLSECSFYANMKGADSGHMNSIDVGKLAQAANVKQLVLTHLPHFGTLTDLVRETSNYYDGPIQLAKIGDTYHI